MSRNTTTFQMYSCTKELIFRITSKQNINITKKTKKKIELQINNKNKKLRTLKYKKCKKQYQTYEYD